MLGVVQGRGLSGCAARHDASRTAIDVEVHKRCDVFPIYFAAAKRRHHRYDRAGKHLAPPVLKSCPFRAKPETRKLGSPFKSNRSLENLFRSPRHINMIVVAPFDFEIAA